jgi:hypothetical protein
VILVQSGSPGELIQPTFFSIFFNLILFEFKNYLRINLFDEMNYIYNDVRFEERAILYNIGVLHLFLGGQEIRRTDSVSLFFGPLAWKI